MLTAERRAHARLLLALAVKPPYLAACLYETMPPAFARAAWRLRGAGALLAAAEKQSMPRLAPLVTHAPVVTARLRQQA